MTLKELITSLAGVMSVSGNERRGGAELKQLIGGVFEDRKSVV